MNRLFSRKKRPRQKSKRQVFTDAYALLERRDLLAFSFGFDGTTLTLDQTVFNGNVTIDNDGTGDAFRVIDGSGTVTFVAAENLVVNLLDVTSSGNQFDLRLNNEHLGDIELYLGGYYDVKLMSSSNSISIGGNLRVVGNPNDRHVIDIAYSRRLFVSGNAEFEFGRFGSEEVSFRNRVSIAGDLTLKGVNYLSGRDDLEVGGSVSMSMEGDLRGGVFDRYDGDSISIEGSFTYIGNQSDDRVSLEDNFSVAGDVTIDLGDGNNIIDMDDTRATTTATVGGLVDIVGGSGDDTLRTDPNLNTFDGDFNVDFGDGSNVAAFTGTFNGARVQYIGGSGIDEVTYGFSSAHPYVNIVLGAGDDLLTLKNTAVAPTAMRVDFGGGVDGFVDDQFGNFDFNVALLNWDGFHRFYNQSLDQWHFFQQADSGDITIDDNGIQNAIRLSNTYTTSMSPASTIRVSMLNNTGNIEVDLDSPLAGYLILHVFDGDRTINLIGDNNAIGGGLIVEANDGNQVIELAVNSPLIVGESAVFNLRGGVDTVDEDGNDISVGGSLIFRGVNEFQNEGALNVGAMLSNTTFEVERSRIKNDGSIDIAGTLIYFGGEELDEIFLDEGVTVGGNVYLNLGSNLDGNPNQVVNLGGGFTALSRVDVIGGRSMNGNQLITDASTIIGGVFVIDFRNNSFSNNVIIAGAYDGNFGLYRGGAGEDIVTLLATAEEMFFVMQLGEGEDTLNLRSSTQLDRLFVNFGGDSDTFVDDFFGTYPFEASFWNL